MSRLYYRECEPVETFLEQWNLEEVNILFLMKTGFNPHTPVEQKIADEMVRGEESRFFKSDLTDPLRFLMHIFWKISIQAFQAFIFQ